MNTDRAQVTNGVWTATELQEACSPCPYCGTYGHTMFRCPEVVAIEYHPNGAIKRIEFRREH